MTKSVKKTSKKELAQIEFEKVVATKMATTELSQFVPRTTFLVDDYTRLVIIDKNRPVVANPRLKEDLEKFGQLDAITVRKNSDGTYSVLNGQHRLYHLKELGLPVECIEIREDSVGNDFDVIKSLNVKGINWSKANYIAHYIKEENQNFKNFNKLVADCPDLTETIIYKFVKGVTGKLKQIYENGTLEFLPTPEQEESLKTLNKLLGLVKSSRKENNSKTYFDRPQIVDLLNDFIQKNEDIKMNIFEKVLRIEGHSFNKETTFENLKALYEKYLV